MTGLLKNPAAILTLNTNGINYKKGNELNDNNIVYDHSIIVEDGIIKDLVPSSAIPHTDQEIDLENKFVFPGLIENHTHLVFAGSRADEFSMKLKGSGYEEIAVAGGGIMKTVRAVRSLTRKELFDITAPRVENFISQGITTLEIKSGYGLDFENEIKILETIKDLNTFYPIDIIPTFLGAHTVPAELKSDRDKYLDIILTEMIPFIARNNLAKFCDGFCESTAFSSREIEIIFSEAKKAKLGLKLHTDQFNSIGGIDTALSFNAASVDHLEVVPDKYYKTLGNSETVCTLLPGVSFFLDYQFAPARDLIDNNAIIALATDYNPGSSNINNIFFIMALAAIKMKMTISEIISAYTINSAKSLDLSSSVGSIEPGKKADFAVFDINDVNEIVYNIGQNPNYMTIKNGRVIWRKKEDD